MIEEPFRAAVWLLDVASGAVHELYEGEQYRFTRDFATDGNGVWIYFSDQGKSILFSLDGRELDRVDGRVRRAPEESRCRRLDEDGPAAEIDGRRFEVNCGVFSPDGSRMLYGVNIDSAEVPLGRYEAHLLDLSTGERALLTDALRHCGGCDPGAAPQWSSSGRYVTFGESYSGDDSTVYLSDTVSGDTRPIVVGPRVNFAGVNPVWSPAEDALLLAADGGGSLIERVASGEVLDLPDLRWPARFDDTGRYVYSASLTTTVIADAATGEVVARWSGHPLHWPLERGITAVGDELAAVLENSSPCSGTAVHHPQAAGGTACIEGARGAAFAPSRDRVAFARSTGGEYSSTRWEIGVFEVSTAIERILASDARGQLPPFLRWNETGTHLLVVWPGPDRP